MKNIRLRFLQVILIIFVITLVGCSDKKNVENLQRGNSNKETNEVEEEKPQEEKPQENGEDQLGFADENQEEDQTETYEYINQAGNILEERINTPPDFNRIDVPYGSLAEFLRTYELKTDGSKVLLYDGSEKGNQSAHVAVFKLPIEKEDLQQCADSIMRVYGEYYYSKGEFDNIIFTLGGGFIADFSKWSLGYGISLSGNNLVWVTSPKNDNSYESFKKFMRIVFAYSGTMNMEADSKTIELQDAQVGDIFIRGGSPGHVVMIVDVCENVNGDKAFLLAQGFMPAQEFHVLKNPLHEDNPWYLESEISYPLNTPQYTFDEGSLRRYKE